VAGAVTWREVGAGTWMTGSPVQPASLAPNAPWGITRTYSGLSPTVRRDRSLAAGPSRPDLSQLP